MTKKISAILLLIVTSILIYIGDKSKFSIPAFGKQLSPTHGFWKNSHTKSNKDFTLKTTYGKVEIFYDERGIPHLFAPNEKALFYAQGYVQAKDRLWQMDFQTRVAGGNLAEAIGKEGIELDRYFRRMCIPEAAQKTYEELKSDTLSLLIAQSFSDGVNAYIKDLKPRELPIEFKLANYSPERWSVKKSILLLKLMSLRLSSGNNDVENTNVAALLGMSSFKQLFPDFPADLSPIIPSEKIYNFESISVQDSFDFEDTLMGNFIPKLPNPLPFQEGIGSNNWAVGKTKTADSSTILCNDPHLPLSFPSIWYEMQLNAPGINVYGVTIPGAPNIIIGFNEEIAWGITNSGRDVLDWYSVEYKDKLQNEYLMDGIYYPIEERIEHIKVKNSKTIIDTFRITEIGPIVYDENFGKIDDQKGLAMHWLALQTSNEMLTFYYLNKAKNQEEYLSALTYFDCPAQNFVYGDRNGNVAIKNQGKFPIQNKDEGKFIQPLKNIDLDQLNQFIPDDQNPYIFNPTRGYVSSANQQPTDSTYPYYYSGIFESYRNRRINQVLDSSKVVTVEDMMRLQNDVYDLMAAEILPYLLNKISIQNLSDPENAILDTLKSWNYFNEYSLSAPSYFQKWWEYIKVNLFDELQDSTIQLRIPRDYQTYHFMLANPEHELVDNKQTDKKETLTDIINKGFKDMTKYFLDDKVKSIWQYNNQSQVEHLMKLKAFSKYNIEIGGSKSSINAVHQEHGPSWRMIVKLSETGVEAYGVYPGGQSGNPGSKHYDDFVEFWRTGQYFPLHFYKNKEEAISKSK